MTGTNGHAASCGCKHIVFTDGLEYCPVSHGLIVWADRLNLPEALRPRNAEQAAEVAKGALVACRSLGFHKPLVAVLVCCAEVENSRKGVVYLCDGDL